MHCSGFTASKLHSSFSKFLRIKVKGIFWLPFNSIVGINVAGGFRLWVLTPYSFNNKEPSISSAHFPMGP